MKEDKQNVVTCYWIKKELEKKLAKRETSDLVELSDKDYDNKVNSYKSKVKYRIEDIIIQKFLHMPKPIKGVRYEPHIIDIAYILSLIYDDEDYQKTREIIKNKIITGMENTLEANELASIFLPFYDRENWDYSDEEFLAKHQKIFQRFLELQKYDSQSCLSDVRQFCIALYNHEKLPPIEKYDELIEIHKKYKNELIKVYKKYKTE